MSNSKNPAHGRVAFRLTAVAVAVMLLASCGKESRDQGTAPADQPAAQAQQAQAAQAVSDEVAALSVDQLREAASKAYREGRLYAPAGDNAVEDYLALRDKQPGDPGVSSALIDLLPMVVIATEQSRDRDDFAEARRLLALIEKTDTSHPALERLRSSIASAEAAVARRLEQQKLTAEQEAQRRQQLERERLEAQRREQEEAARQLALQQQAAAEAARLEAERQEAARREAERQEAARLEAERQEAARREAERRQAAAAAAPVLRAISTPAPRFPAEALRSGVTGEEQVEFTVGVDGSVTSARVVRADPPRIFDREAINAVRRWRFEPVPAPVTTRRTIAFTPGE